jgi:hypothetical protein
MGFAEQADTASSAVKTVKMRTMMESWYMYEVR